MLAGFIYNFQVEWSNICQDALNNVERLYQGKGTTDIIQSKVLQVYGLLCVCVFVDIICVPMKCCRRKPFKGQFVY
jgi:hypothetical protein